LEGADLLQPLGLALHLPAQISISSLFLSIPIRGDDCAASPPPTPSILASATELGPESLRLIACRCRQANRL